MSLFILAALAAAHPGPASDVAGVAASAAVARRLRADVSFLSSADLEGRRAGSSGAERAARWIARGFEEIGLQPADPAGSFLTTFSFLDGIRLGPLNSLVTAAGVRTRTWRPGVDFAPAALSASGKAEGTVVFAGYGIDAPALAWNDYAGLDVAGSVVLALRYGPGGADLASPFAPYTVLRHKAETARRHGARALLVVSGPGTPGAADDLVGRRADTALEDAGLPVLSVKQEVARAILSGSGRSLDEAHRALDRAGRPASFPLPGTRVRLDADVLPQRTETSNVTGLLSGRNGAGSEMVVVAAHYDHLGRGGPESRETSRVPRVHPGADDNASGVAGILELARRLGPRAGTLGRSVLFAAFGAEEEGALGSLHFTREPPVPLSRMTAMVNLDMVGRLGDDGLAVYGAGTSPAWKRLLSSAAAGTGLVLLLHDGGSGLSDHGSFHAAGRPAVLLFTGLHGDYHRASDVAGKLRYEGEVRVLAFAEALILALAGEPAPLPFSPLPPGPSAAPAGAAR